MRDLVVEAIRNAIADTSTVAATKYLAKQLWHSSDMRMSVKTVGEMLAASICPDRDLRQKRSNYFFSLACSVTDLPPLRETAQHIGVATEEFSSLLPPEYLSSIGKIRQKATLRYAPILVQIDRAVADMFQALPRLR